jgi:hypothetical protein
MNGAITISGPFKSFRKRERVSGIDAFSLDPAVPAWRNRRRDWENCAEFYHGKVACIQ